MDFKYKSKNQYHPAKPNGILYTLAVWICHAYMYIVYRLRIDKTALKKIKSPVVALGTHQSNLDFIVLASALFPIKLNFMVTTFFVRHHLLGKLLRFMGAIPKKQFVPDIGSVRACLTAAKNNQSLGIFPEGQVSFTGATSAIDKSIAKLVKKMGITVVTCKMQGNHLSSPKWANGKQYHGKIVVTTKVVLTPEQLKEMSIDQIYSCIKSELSYNDYEWQRENHIVFKPNRITDGIQSILYRCPVCNTDFSIEATNKRIFCQNCDYLVEIDNYGFFHALNGNKTVFDNPVDWFNYEFEQVKIEMENGSLPFTSNCVLYKTIEGQFGYSKCGFGTMIADYSGLSFVGEKDNEPFSFMAAVEHQTNLTHNMTVGGVDVVCGDENFGLAPDDIRKMIKFVIMYQIAVQSFEKKHATGN